MALLTLVFSDRLPGRPSAGIKHGPVHCDGATGRDHDPLAAIPRGGGSCRQEAGAEGVKQLKDGSGTNKPVRDKIDLCVHGVGLATLCSAVPLCTKSRLSLIHRIFGYVCLFVCYFLLGHGTPTMFGTFGLRLGLNDGQ